MQGKQTRRRVIPFGWRLLDALPVIFPAALASFGAIATILLLGGQLRTGLVWPLGLIVAAFVAWIIYHNYPNLPRSKERNWTNAIVFLGILTWGAFNFLHTAQHIITNRDPGTYTNAAIWLVHHNNINIPQSNVFGAVTGISGDSGGFYPHNGHVWAQGLHLLPIFLGLIGRIVGIAHMLHFNVLFGMTALLAIYAFARQIVRPFWAMVITGALAASMPFIYFSRDTYTEPLAATFTFGALALIGLAIKSKKTSLWFIAGLVAGAGMLTRIDSLLTFAELTIFAGIMVALSQKIERRLSVKNAVALIVGMAATTLIGWLDVSRLSTHYYQSLHHDILKEVLAIIVAVTMSLIIVVISWQTTIFRRLDKRSENWRSDAAAIIVLLAAIILVSRPLWFRGYTPFAVFNYRTYAELATEWVAWYAGSLLAILGVIGLALGSAYAVRKNRLLLSAGLLVIMGTSAVYLVNPNISPDQIWASRRLVPVILPGIAIFGALALDWLSVEYLPRLQWRYLYVGIAAVAIVLGPLITSKPLIRERDTALLPPLINVCNDLPKKAAVLWVGIARTQLIQPTAGICNAAVDGYGPTFVGNVGPSRTTLSLAAINAQQKGYTPVIGMYGSNFSLLFPASEQGNFTTVSTYTESQLDNPITRAPDMVNVIHDSIIMGIIQPDGSIHPL